MTNQHAFSTPLPSLPLVLRSEIRLFVPETKQSKTQTCLLRFGGDASTILII